MKKFGVLGIGLLAFSTACSGGGFGGDSPTYSGKIVDWPAAKTGSVIVGIPVPSNPPVTGQPATVDVNGNFSSLMFPSGKNLALSETTSPCTQAAWNPTTVKGAVGTIGVLNSANANAGQVVEGTKNFNSSGSTAVVGDKQVLRFYVDVNATLKGTCTSGNPSSTTIFDLNLTAGWNVVVLEVTKVSGTTVTEGKATSGSLPINSKLFFSASGAALSIGNLFR